MAKKATGERQLGRKRRVESWQARRLAAADGNRGTRSTDRASGTLDCRTDREGGKN